MLEKNQHEPVVVRILKPFFKNWFVRIATIGFVLACVLVIVRSCQAASNHAQQIQTQLEVELKAIPPLANAQIVDYSLSYPQKTTLVLVSADYLTNAKREHIFQYYDTQLRKHGWKYEGTTGPEDWGVDVGRNVAKYCKGDYVATVAYTGEDANRGWTYGLGMSWRLYTCEEK